MPLGPNKDLVVRYITFRDSPYETPPAIEMLENEGKKGYAILLEGVKSGSAKVRFYLNVQFFSQSKKLFNIRVIKILI